ncbi:MAG TPA: hypothetical protein VGJ15_06990 [Pirellulales bacterium]
MPAGEKQLCRRSSRTYQPNIPEPLGTGKEGGSLTTRLAAW